jgi:hypothetical protein
MPACFAKQKTGGAKADPRRVDEIKAGGGKKGNFVLWLVGKLANVDFNVTL